MTKKDYELIAGVLNFRKKQINERVYKLLIADFINTLASKNPRFNKEKFLQACGVEVEQKCACDGCNNVAEQYYKKEKYCDGHYCMIHATQ